MQNTDTFSCDSFSKSLNLPAVSGYTAAQIKDWIDYLYTIFDWCKDKCPANNHGEWDQDNCPRLAVNQSYDEFVKSEAEAEGWSDYDLSDYDYSDYWSDYDYGDYDYSDYDYWSDYDYTYDDGYDDYDYGSDYDYTYDDGYDYDDYDYGSAPRGAPSPPGRGSKETLTKRKYRRHGRNTSDSTGDTTGKVIPLYMVSKGDSYSLVKVVARLEYAYLANAANENSGSIKQLILDAGLKRNESGFAVMPLVNYEEYYTKAKVSQW